MEYESWLCGLAFLVDITTHMNDLNTKLQRQAQYANEMYRHIKGFMNKLRLWQAYIQDANLCHFPTLKECVPRRRLNLQINLKYYWKNFWLALKTSNSMNISLKYSLHHFTQTLTKPQLIFKWNWLIFKRGLTWRPSMWKWILAIFTGNISTRISSHNWENSWLLKCFFLAQRIRVNNFFSKMGFMKSPYRSVLTDEHLDNGLRVASTSIKVNLDKVVKKKPTAYFSLNCFHEDKISCPATLWYAYFFSKQDVLSNNTSFTVFDIFAKLFLSESLSLVVKVCYIKVRPVG